MKEEFKRGGTLVERIFLGRAKWTDLFERHTFFQDYKHYLQVWATAESSELSKKWSVLKYTAHRPASDEIVVTGLDLWKASYVF